MPGKWLMILTGMYFLPWIQWFENNSHFNFVALFAYFSVFVSFSKKNKKKTCGDQIQLAHLGKRKLKGSCLKALFSKFTCQGKQVSTYVGAWTIIMIQLAYDIHMFLLIYKQSQTDSGLESSHCVLFNRENWKLLI